MMFHSLLALFDPKNDNMVKLVENWQLVAMKIA